ncbi:MAG: hypothetical protein WC726_02385 [Parcubacteria group bacterium]
MLLAFPFSVRAVVIDKSFLLEGGDETTANIAGHKSSQWVEMFFVAAAIFSIDNVLNFIKQIF